MATVAPIDREAIIAAASETKGIVTAEEHIVRGGLGGAVAEVVVSERPVPMRLLGFPGFCPTGSPTFLLEHARHHARRHRRRRTRGPRELTWHEPTSCA